MSLRPSFVRTTYGHRLDLPGPRPIVVDIHVTTHSAAVVNYPALWQMVLDASRAACVSVEAVLGSRRKAAARVRRHVMLSIREQYRLSYPEIGRLFNRDHSTVMTACRKAAEERRSVA